MFLKCLYIDNIYNAKLSIPDNYGYPVSGFPKCGRIWPSLSLFKVAQIELRLAVTVPEEEEEEEDEVEEEEEEDEVQEEEEERKPQAETRREIISKIN